MHRATMVAARRVPSLYCYESPSTTVDFRPVRFVPIDAHLDAKVGVIDAYQSQVSTRSYLDEDLVQGHQSLLGPVRREPLLRTARGGAGAPEAGATDGGGSSGLAELRGVGSG